MATKNSSHRFPRWTTLFPALLCMLLPQEIKAEDASLIKDYGVKDYIRVSKDFPHSEQNPWKLEPKFYPGQHLEFLGD